MEKDEERAIVLRSANMLTKCREGEGGCWLEIADPGIFSWTGVALEKGGVCCRYWATLTCQQSYAPAKFSLGGGLGG